MNKFANPPATRFQRRDNGLDFYAVARRELPAAGVDGHFLHGVSRELLAERECATLVGRERLKLGGGGSDGVPITLSSNHPARRW